MTIALDGTAIIAKLDRIVRIRVALRIADHLDQGLALRFTIHRYFALEKPMPRVLTVALCTVEELHVGGVALQHVHEQVRIVIQIPFVESESW